MAEPMKLAADGVAPTQFEIPGSRGDFRIQILNEDISRGVVTSIVHIPAGGFIHVDTDPMVPGVAYPEADTYPVQAEVGEFLRTLLEVWPQREPAPTPSLPRPHPAFPSNGSGDKGRRVRPDALMAAVQRHVVDGSDAVVLAESGNAFTWATHYLRFATPGRYRVSTNLGSMGHAATGVIGAALGANGTAVAIIGDGAMLMNSSEVNTAVKRGVPAVWIVLNDARYNMCHQGMAALKMDGMTDAFFPAVDFAQLARSMGAVGLRVEAEGDLEQALSRAMAVQGPVVIDVLIDAEVLAPTQGRNEGLRPTRIVTRHEGMSFPVLSTD